MIAIGVAAPLMNGCQRGREERALRQQVREYQRAVEEGRFDRMWDFLSERMKDGNPDGPEGFRRIYSGMGLTNIHFATDAVHITRDIALVRVRMTCWSTVDKKTFIGIDEDKWIKEHGRWVFDDSRTLKEEER